VNKFPFRNETLTENQAEVYNKANSILELRADKASLYRTLDRIRALHHQLSREHDSVNQRRRVVLTACDDLLENGGNKKFWLRDHVIEEIERLHEDELEPYLYYRYRYDVYPAERIVDDYPPCVQIEPTSICNFRCIFCYQTDRSFTDKRNGHQGMMSLDLFKRVVDQLEGEVESVTLASRGEPLASPNFSEMIKYLSGKFLAVKVNTNASLLDERKSHAILESNIQTLVFSADAANESMYSKLRVNGNFKNVLKNIKRFLKIRKHHYPESRLITRISGVDYSQGQDPTEMKRFWGHLVDQVIFVSYNPWENVYEISRNNIEKPCSDLWRRLFVWWDGRVNPCDVDYKSTLSPGTVENNTISEYWRGDLFEKLRQKHLAGLRQKIYPCLGCSLI